MPRASFLLSLIVLFGSLAQAQSDEQALAKIRTSAKQIFLDQASWTLPDSFHESGLAPPDKERLIKQWASDSADCLADSLVAYAETTDIPLSEMVSDDGSFTLKGDGSSSEFHLFLETCMESAWAGIGARSEGLAKQR